jgi:hypothetical protein
VIDGLVDPIRRLLKAVAVYRRAVDYNCAAAVITYRSSKSLPICRRKPILMVASDLSFVRSVPCGATVWVTTIEVTRGPKIGTFQSFLATSLDDSSAIERPSELAPALPLLNSAQLPTYRESIITYDD